MRVEFLWAKSRRAFGVCEVISSRGVTMRPAANDSIDRRTYRAARGVLRKFYPSSRWVNLRINERE